jgi:hypothetical protein
MMSNVVCQRGDDLCVDLFQCGCISYRTAVWAVMPACMIGRLEISAYTRGLDLLVIES